MLMLLLYFCTAFCLKLFTICHFVTIAYTWMICKQSFLYLRYGNLRPFISKSDSSAVESSPRNPWIEGSNPGALWKHPHSPRREFQLRYGYTSQQIHNRIVHTDPVKHTIIEARSRHSCIIDEHGQAWLANCRCCLYTIALVSHHG